jgi:hypothetical protein
MGPFAEVKRWLFPLTGKVQGLQVPINQSQICLGG